MIEQRVLARDLRDDRVGEVMAEASTPGAKGQYWLRPVGGGTEWPVPVQEVEVLDREVSGRQ
jgi:hypothetical protein